VFGEPGAGDELPSGADDGDEDAGDEEVDGLLLDDGPDPAGGPAGWRRTRGAHTPAEPDLVARDAGISGGAGQRRGGGRARGRGRRHRHQVRRLTERYAVVGPRSLARGFRVALAPSGRAQVNEFSRAPGLPQTGTPSSARGKANPMNESPRDVNIRYSINAQFVTGRTGLCAPCYRAGLPCRVTRRGRPSFLRMCTAVMVSQDLARPFPGWWARVRWQTWQRTNRESGNGHRVAA